jgi:tetratricopeptide (TPR) repeat protein
MSNHFPHSRAALFLVILVILCNRDARALESQNLDGADMKHNTEMLRAAVSESSAEADLFKAGVICSQKKDAHRTLVVNDIQPGSIAAFSGLSSGDTILRVEKSATNFYVTIDRKGKIYRADLSGNAPQLSHFGGQSIASRKPTEPQNSEKSDSAPRLPGSYSRNSDLSTRFADLWIARYHEPSNLEIRRELDVVEKELEYQVRLNGGSWHICEYYAPSRWEHGEADPRYLLNGGVRLYAIGDLRNARRIFEETLRVDANNADANFNLGALCESEGRISEASTFYLKAKSLGLNLDAERSHEYANNPKLNAETALQNVGNVTVTFQGGLKENARERRRIYHHACEGTCSICRIFRDAMMDGH